MAEPNPWGNIVAVGRWLQSLGFQVSEHPAFGGVHPVHAQNSWHYKGHAIDVNWPGGGPSELAMFHKVEPDIRAHLALLDPLLEDLGARNQHMHIAFLQEGSTPNGSSSGSSSASSSGSEVASVGSGCLPATLASLTIFATGVASMTLWVYGLFS